MAYISVEEAQKALYTKSCPLPTKKIKIEDALGYILADDIIAKVTQPPFRRSAMDGYAVHIEDVMKATEETPVELPVIAATYAGDAVFEPMPKKSAIRIMTGAPIPDDANCIIPQEWTDYGEEKVKIYRSGELNGNCVPKGEDFNCGDRLAQKGHLIDAYTIASAVAGGVDKVNVYQKINVAIITTGSELVSLGHELVSGQIYNSNEAFFKSRLMEFGCHITFCKAASDEPVEIEKAIREASQYANCIITTGGISVGKKDYLPEVIDALQAEVIFRGINIKPGAPTMAAIYKEKTILCLSGNPYSAIAMFEVLFPYYEQKALQRQFNRLIPMEVITSNGYEKLSKSRRLVRGILSVDGVYIPNGQKNGQLQAGIGCNCLVDIAAGTEYIAPRSKVKLFLLQNR